MAHYQQLTHEFAPVFNKTSKILILGTFPSVKSREQQFYYGHPQNRFWKVLAALTKESIPLTIPEKKQLLLKHQIALWDVIQRCEIIGSSDSSIRNVVPADIPSLLEQSSITAIFGNGSKACELFKKYTLPLLSQKTSTNIEDGKTITSIYKLPSTSPANASWNLARLISDWKKEIEPFLL